MNDLASKSKESPISDPALAYTFACERHAYELGQTIARNNFFMVFQGVIFAGALNVGALNKSDWMWALLGILGMAMSVLQFRMAAAGRFQILSAERTAALRETDLLASMPPKMTRYHFYTQPRAGDGAADARVSFGLASYENVSSMRRRSGFKTPPQECDWFCHPIASSILARWLPSTISIWVAIVLFVFWLALLVLQFVELPSFPRFSFRT